VQRCWLIASLEPPTFAYEGAFCSWLARVLIDEALAIRRPNNQDNLELECVVVSKGQGQALQCELFNLAF
jgi:hypothetical protein